MFVKKYLKKCNSGISVRKKLPSLAEMITHFDNHFIIVYVGIELAMKFDVDIVLCLQSSDKNVILIDVILNFVFNYYNSCTVSQRENLNYPCI